MSDEKTYSQMRREFYEKYQRKFVPYLQQFEHERKCKLVLAAVLASIFGILGTLLLSVIFFLESKKDCDGIVKLAILLYGLAWGSWYSVKKEFESKIKKQIMPQVCKCFGDMRWSEGSYSDTDLFVKAGLIPAAYSGADYDDVFTGSYKDVKIEIVEAEFDVGTGKNRRTVFNGVMVKLDMNKNFSGHTIIKPDGFFHNSPLPELKQTMLEDVQFEKKFDVFTDDEVEARYLLTPSFMERLKNMQTAFKADKISCSFHDKYLIIALHTNKDLFSLCSLVKPVDDSRQYFTMYEEIVSIIKLIDHFKLDQKIGL